MKRKDEDYNDGVAAGLWAAVALMAVALVAQRKVADSKRA